jgi:hypothetical protein
VGAGSRGGRIAAVGETRPLLQRTGDAAAGDGRCHSAAAERAAAAFTFKDWEWCDKDAPPPEGSGVLDGPSEAPGRALRFDRDRQVVSAVLGALRSVAVALLDRARRPNQRPDDHARSAAEADRADRQRR